MCNYKSSGRNTCFCPWTQLDNIYTPLVLGGGVVFGLVCLEVWYFLKLGHLGFSEIID